MAVNFGRLEAKITVPTGGWTLSLTDDGAGPTTATLPAGSYYMTSLLAALIVASDAVMANNWTWSIADGESASGKVTVTHDGDVCEVAWVATDLRDLLGFENDGNLTGADTYTSTDSGRMIWLPDGTKTSAFGDADTDGWSESDASSVESPAGHAKVLRFQRKDVNAVTWHGISRSRCRIAGETVINQSFEKFWEDAIQGEGPGGNPGGPINLYWDADTSTKTNFAVVGSQLKKFTAQRLSRDLVEYWTVPLDRLVKVPV